MVLKVDAAVLQSYTGGSREDSATRFILFRECCKPTGTKKKIIINVISIQLHHGCSFKTARQFNGESLLQSDFNMNSDNTENNKKYFLSNKSD